jgi:serine protease Do
VEAAPTGSIPAPGEIGQITIGQTMRGRLEPGDQTMGDTFADSWQFQGTAGRTVTIDVRSSSFGTYVQLFDVDGNRLADDSGSGGGNNSRIVFLLGSTGSYQVVVVNGEGQRTPGLYTISVR